MYSKWLAESENCMLVVNARVMHIAKHRLNIVNSVFAKDSLIKNKQNLVHGLNGTMQNMAHQQA